MTMKVLILGPTGYIGCVIAARFLARGDVEGDVVCAVGRSVEAEKMLSRMGITTRIGNLLVADK